MFHEPLTLFSYLAAITQRLELVSGVIVLPQRQRALVAGLNPASQQSSHAPRPFRPCSPF
jgi:hypothetical protein